MFNIFSSIKKDKKGFTVIELLATLIVLGTFILLAAPKFMGLIEVAEETRIQNDVRIAENLSVLEIYKNGFDLANNKDINKGNCLELALDIKNAVENGKAYDIKGKIQDIDTLKEEVFFELDEKFIENDLRTNLNGRFLSTNNARVIYIETEDTGKTLQDKANNIKTAFLEKFNRDDSYQVAEINIDELKEMTNEMNIEDTEELLKSYTSLLSSIK